MFSQSISSNLLFHTTDTSKFNVSSLGLGEFHNVTSPLYTNITALIPSDANNLTSITQYLGVYDWYSMHYLITCFGFFAPSTVNPSLFTKLKVNSACARQTSGYTFKLHDVIEDQLLPSVRDLANSVSTAEYMTNTWSSLWYAGIGNCVLTAMVLLQNFAGKRPWLNGWICCDAFVRPTSWSLILYLYIKHTYKEQIQISAALLLASSAMVTNTIVTVRHTKGLQGPNEGSEIFLPMMWSTTVLMAAVAALMWLQGRLDEKHGQFFGEEHEMRVRGDAELMEEWKSQNTFVEGHNM